MSANAPPPAPGYTDTKDDLRKRLNRIEGQVRGIQGMVDELVTILAAELADVNLNRSLAPVPDDVQVTPYIGRYHLSDDAIIDVREGADGLEAAFTTAGAWAAFHGDFVTPMQYAGGSTFLMTMPPLTKPVAATFVREDPQSEAITHLATQMRIAPRTSQLGEAV